MPVLTRSFRILSLGLSVSGLLQLTSLRAAPEVEESPFGFILEAPGGHYERHRVQIPPKATGVTVKVTILESYTDARWGSATSIGFGKKLVENPNDTDLFARLTYDEKQKSYRIRLRTAGRPKDIATSTVLTPGTTFTWSADWSSPLLVLRVDKQVLSDGVPDITPEILHLSVSGLKVRVEDVSFKFPSP